MVVILICHKYTLLELPAMLLFLHFVDVSHLLLVQIRLSLLLYFSNLWILRGNFNIRHFCFVALKFI